MENLYRKVSTFTACVKYGMTASSYRHAGECMRLFGASSIVFACVLQTDTKITHRDRRISSNDRQCTVSGSRKEFPARETLSMNLLDSRQRSERLERLSSTAIRVH